MSDTKQLRLFRFKGVVYMIDSVDARVYCYNPDCPVQVGTWNSEQKKIIFLDGAMDALYSGSWERVVSLHRHS